MSRHSLRCFFRTVHNGLAQLWNATVRTASAGGSKPYHWVLVAEGKPCQPRGVQP